MKGGIVSISQKNIGLIGTQAQAVCEFLNESLFANSDFVALPIDNPIKDVDAASTPDLESFTALIYLFSATTGLETWVSEHWSHARELYIPSLVAVTDLDKTEDLDFEDATLIIGRMLDPVITPHLILHGDQGEPIALIDIEKLTITRYDLSPVETSPAESEHNLLVLEFRQELFNKYEEMGREGFEQGLLFPAIPLILSRNGLGTREIYQQLLSL